MLPEYTPGANLYDYAFYGPMQTDDNAMLSSFQVGGMPWGQQQQQQQQGGGGDDEIMQYIQMYSEITESDPEEVMSQISSMSQEDQQAALQEMVGTVQKYYTMQQSRQQNQMVDEQQQSMYDEEDESAQPAQYQKSYNTPTPEELAGLEAEEEQYNAAVEAATADYGEEDYMYGGSKRGRNKFTSQLKKAARGMAQEMVNTDGLPTGDSSYGGERLKKFVAGIQRNVANTMADEAVEQSMDYFSQPPMMRYGGLPTFQGNQNSQTGNTSNTGNISLTPEQFNQLLAAQNRGATPQYPGMGRSVNMSNLLSMFGAAPISNDWFQPRGYSLTRKSARDFADAQKVYGSIPLDRSYLSNVEAKKGFLGNINNPRTLSMQFSRSLPPLNFPQETSTTPASSQTQSSSWNPNVITSTNGTGIQGAVSPVTIGSSSYGLNSPSPAPQPTASNQSTQQQVPALGITGLPTQGLNPSIPRDPSYTGRYGQAADNNFVPNSAAIDYMRQSLTPIDLSGAGPINLTNQSEVDALKREESFKVSQSNARNKKDFYQGNSYQTGGSTLYDIVKSKGYDPSFESRKKIFQDYFDEPYTGTYEQNSTLKKELLSGNIQLVNDINRKKNTDASKTVQQPKTTNVSSRSSQIDQSNNQKPSTSKVVNQARKQNTKEVNNVNVKIPPLLERRNGIDFRNTGNSPFQGDGYYENKDLRSNLESGVIVDKATGTINFVRAGKIDQKFPVLTGLAGKNYETDPNANPYPVSYLKDNPAARSTPTGTYNMKYDKSIYGYPGYYQKPIAAFGEDAPIATTPLAMHVVYGAGAKPGYTWDPSQGKGAKPHHDPVEYQSRLKRFNEPDNRFGSYGCTNFEPYSLECLTERFGTEGDTAVYIDSRNPEDKKFIENFPVAPPLKNKQNGGQLYLYKNGGLPRFQGPDASEVTLAPRSISNPGQSAKTFGDTEFAMEPFDNSALVGARPQPMQLPTKTLQERAQEIDPDASMKTFGLKFRKDPLSAAQYADAAYAGTNIITNLKNRADQELAQAEMLNSETDPYNYFAQTYANPDEGININTYDMSRPYQSFMGQRQQFSPGVSSGFAKFGGMMKMGGTYEMDLSPEEVAYIQRMGGTIEYL